MPEGRHLPDDRSSDLAIVVVNYGSHVLLESNLGALDLSGTDCRIIVVDNFSTVVERREVQILAQAHNWSLVCEQDNGGFSRGVNSGVRKARDLGCRSVILLNPDAQITIDVVAELRRFLQQNPKALVCPKILDSRHEVVFAGGQLWLDSGRVGRPDLSVPVQSRASWLTGACLAMTLPMFDEIGGFDESYFLYWEDVDFTYRATLAGADLVVRDDLVVVHDEGGTQGEKAGRAKSNVYYYFNCRNRLAFAARRLPSRAVWRWILSTPRQSWAILMRGGRRQLLDSPGPLLAAVRGSLAGLAIALRAVQGRSPEGHGREQQTRPHIPRGLG